MQHPYYSGTGAAAGGPMGLENSQQPRQGASGLPPTGASGTTSSSVLLHRALYGPRPSAGAAGGAYAGGTALYRNYDTAPRDKSILAAVVDSISK